MHQYFLVWVCFNETKSYTITQYKYKLSTLDKKEYTFRKKYLPWVNFFFNNIGIFHFCRDIKTYFVLCFKVIKKYQIHINLIFTLEGKTKIIRFFCVLSLIYIFILNHEVFLKHECGLSEMHYYTVEPLF